MFNKRNVCARPPKRQRATNFHEPGLSAYRAIQLPARTARPAAILTRIVLSALGEMSCSAKKLSRRLRKTFGKEEPPNGSIIGHAGVSDGTRSDISGS